MSNFNTREAVRNLLDDVDELEGALKVARVEIEGERLALEQARAEARTAKEERESWRSQAEMMDQRIASLMEEVDRLTPVLPVASAYTTGTSTPFNGAIGRDVVKITFNPPSFSVDVVTLQNPADYSDYFIETTAEKNAEDIKERFKRYIKDSLTEWRDINTH